jgi:hypothetical protein
MAWTKNLAKGFGEEAENIYFHPPLYVDDKEMLLGFMQCDLHSSEEFL